MYKKTKKAVAVLSACLLVFTIIGNTSVSAESVPIETSSLTFADYYAMSDEELNAIFREDFNRGCNYLRDAPNSPNLLCYYTEEYLDEKLTLGEMYSDGNFDLDPEKKEAFCAMLGDVPAEYIESVTFDLSTSTGVGLQENFDPETGSYTVTPLYLGFKITIATPEDYQWADTLPPEQAKTIFILQHLVKERTQVYITEFAYLSDSLPPQYTGDLNRDYTVNLQDLVLLKKALAGGVELEDSQIARADCNGNGILDADDAYRLLCFLTQTTDVLNG